MKLTREAIIRWLIVKSGTNLMAKIPRWLMIIWRILFPLKAIAYKVQSEEGYQPLTNTWKIHGLEYSDEDFQYLAESEGPQTVLRIHNRAVVRRVHRVSK